MITLQGIITDAKTGAVVTGANVKLVGDDNLAVEVTTDNTGIYYFDLTPLRSYEIIVNREDYLNNKVTETTVGIEVNTDIVRDITITPIKKEIIMPRIEYDFAKWDLRPQSILDLDLLIITLNENPNIIIELKSHTDFRGTEKQNLMLSQKRADACIQYLISKGIDMDRLVSSGKGESQPYKLEANDAKHDQRGGLFTKKIFKEGDILTESYINKLKNKFKETAHQYNRRTTFTIIPPEIKEIESK